MTRPALAFAVPGDITTLTGGTIYDCRLLGGLRALGHAVEHIELPATYPNPTAADSVMTAHHLNAVGPDTPLIIDGLAFGAIPTVDIANITAPIIALIHHPLALENGLAQPRRDQLFETERNNLALAHHVLVPSNHTADILVSDYAVPRDKITIIRPGTDRVQTGGAKSDPPLILSVGIQAPRKGHDVLLRALADITDIPWRAAIVGRAHDTDHEAFLKTLRQDLRLTDRVEITGEVSGDTLSSLYQQASIFALATRYEGYGIVFDEAQVHGLPIVSCATGAVPDTVPATAGLLVPVDAPMDFADALRGLLLDPNQMTRLAKAAHDASRALPDWSQTARTASDAIQSALAKDHPDDR